MNRPYQHERERWLGRAVALLVLLTCLRVWTGPVFLVPSVQAQLPDPALQRKQLLEESRRTNRLLVEIK